MTDAAGALRRRIASQGPVTVAEFMRVSVEAYYARGEAIGAAGDFVTAPEVSQVFGELIGLWCAEAWAAAGRPAPIRWVELGPGHGTLIADAARAAADAAPDFLAAATLHLVEPSAAMRARQRATLDAAAGAPAPTWHEVFDDVPAGPVVLVANELFDALPVRQYVRGADGWAERRVGWDAAAGRFVAVAVAAGGPPPGAAAEAAGVGDVVEAAPERESLARAIGARVAVAGGAALVLDYGPARSAPGETLQAVRGHAYADPFEHPGEADVTAHVDFEALAAAAAGVGAAVDGPVPQGLFLGRLGIEARARALIEARPEAADAVHAAVRRLVHPGSMGLLFKALAIRRPAAPAAPGFVAGRL